VLALWLVAGTPAPLHAQDGAVERGAYLFAAAGCLGCHTMPKTGKPLAGGRRLDTPFGTFVSPNITPDQEHGLGAWTLDDFSQALREGRSPDGSAYYPVFPFTSYAGLTDADVADLWAYMQSVETVGEANRPHEISWPFSMRWLATVWQWLFFDGAVYASDSGQSEQWNRGAYLVRHLGHCGECHTERNLFGAVVADRELAGNLNGPEGKKVPNITPDSATGIGDWVEIDHTYFMETGFLPDGDFTGGAMEEVVENTTSRLTLEDRKAIAAYLMALPPLPAP